MAKIKKSTFQSMLSDVGAAVTICMPDAVGADNAVLGRTTSLKSGLRRAKKLIVGMQKAATTRQAEIKKRYARDHKDWKQKNNTVKSTKKKRS